MPTFQGYGLARYMKYKIDINIPKECGPSKEQESKGSTWREILIHALEKRLKGRGRKRKLLKRG